MVTIEDSDAYMSDLESNSYEDDDGSFMMDDEEEIMAPMAKKKLTLKGKKAASANKKKNPILSPRSEGAGNIPSAVTTDGATKKKKKTIEETYQKKTPHEHVLCRPDTYVGSVEPMTEKMFVYDHDQEAIVNKTITYTPGLFKIFDEIIVNAADNKQRDPNMDKLDVTINAEKNTISVKNNGLGIPVEYHSEHNCYVPTLIFSHLLTGSNFDDDEEKTTGGRNGYGAKLANIFSTEFIVECMDVKKGKKFHQVFTNNMTTVGKPIIKNCTAAEKKKGDYTKITFSPDLEKFKMTSLDEDTVALLSKRAYDIAGSMCNIGGKNLVVTLNGKKVPIKSFQDYIKIFKGVNPPCAFEKVDDNWEVGVSHSEDGTPVQISFVNAICTSKGGTHVNFVADKLTKSLAAAITKKNKGGTKITPGQIKNHLCIFVNCRVKNPSFDSQTKEHLNSRKTCYKDECQLSDKFLKKVCAVKGDIMDNILSFATFKARRELKKTGGVKRIQLKGIPKLDDANRAGSKDSLQCTLILTEGDSAKSLAMSGLSVIGRDHYGVYPLKGKPLNVRDATHKAVMANEEIKNVIEILGLKHEMVYDESNVKTLRYGHLMIMADQDHDGSHIKGLIINLIHSYWPSLLDIPGFLQQFITPIVKVTKGKKSETFFTIPQYEEWKEGTGNDGKGWKIKYYKGLGTSTAADAKQYFSNLDLHEIDFRRISEDKETEEETMIDSDGENEGNVSPDNVKSYGDTLIDMVFSKKRADDRKDWLQNFKKDTYLDYADAREAEGVKYSQFINEEYILFSKADCERSIPHVMDGFKPSQRKVLFACFKRKLKEEIKVAQLAGYIGEHSAYHHGEQSLHSTIINMAQSFVGSNNINLLTPSGQFGTRRLGGKDAASPRYIFTMLEKVTRTIFHPDDDELLNYRTDDGLSIEPDYFMPVIPMVLVNGSDGIGTGWSSKIPNYDPRQIISNIRNMINEEPVETMHPFYSGFRGEIAPDGDKKYSVKGIIERVNETTLLISELPVRTWTQDCKNLLEKMLETEKDASVGAIKDFNENHTDTTVSFQITAEKEQIDKWEKEPKGGLYKKFKLIASSSTTNMHLFDKDSKIAKYESPESILEIFFETRMEFYVKRKELLVKNLQREQSMLSNKARFIEEVCSGNLVVSNRKKVELLNDLQSRGYDLFNKANDRHDNASSDDEDEDSASVSDLSKGYEYLLGMKLWALTFEKAELLRRQLAEKTAELEELQAKEPSHIWLEDLDAIDEALDERDQEIAQAEKDEMKAQNRTAKRQSKKAKAGAKKQAKKKKTTKKDAWDSDDEDSDEDMNEIAPIKKKTARKPTAKKLVKPKTIGKPVISITTKTGSDDKTNEGTAASRTKRPSPKPAQSRARVKKSKVLESNSDEDIDVEVLKEEVEVMNMDSDEDVAPAKKPAKGKSSKARAKEIKLMDSDSEEEVEVLDMDSEDDVAPAKARSRATRAKANPIKYSYSDDEDDDDSFMCPSDDDSDF